jgi:hypothetical protein
MVSTGMFWQPVHAISENAPSDEMELLAVNAGKMKNVPEEMTDMREPNGSQRYSEPVCQGAILCPQAIGSSIATNHRISGIHVGERDFPILKLETILIMLQ